MDQDEPASSTQPSEPPEEDLRSLLLEAERRNKAAYQGKSRALTLVFWVPVISVLAWATYVYRENQRSFSAPQAMLILPVETPEPTDTSEFDNFRPEAMRVGNKAPHAPAAKQTAQLIDKEDIDFAMQLLNFMQAPARREPKDEQPSK
jgi:hypothetical protein